MQDDYDYDDTETIDEPTSSHWITGFICLPNKFGDDIECPIAFRVLFKIMTLYYLTDPVVSFYYVSDIAKVSVSDALSALNDLEVLGYVKQIKNDPERFRVVRFFNITPMFGH